MTRLASTVWKHLVIILWQALDPAWLCDGFCNGMYDAFGDKSRSSDAAHALRTYEERAHTDQAPTSCLKAVRAFNIRAWIELAISCNTAQQPYWCRLLKTGPIQTQQPDAVFYCIFAAILGWDWDEPMMIRWWAKAA